MPLAAVPAPATDPESVVRTFLHALEQCDIDAALALVAEDLAYTNVSLPTIHGRARLDRLARPLVERGWFGFEAYLHTVAVEGDRVLTERTDVLVTGPVRSQFWVYGRFEVRDGLITVWRDSFDWGDITVGMARGVLGAVVPALGRRPPSA